MHVRNVPIVHYGPNVPKLRKGITEKFIIQKEYVRKQLLNKETGEVYGKRKIECGTCLRIFEG